MKPVFCLGDICMDLVLPLGAVKRAEHGEPIARAETDAVFRHGGSVANTAAGLLRLGIPVQFCGTVGRDAYGDALKSELASLGADVSTLRSDPESPTLLIAIVVDENGERTALATHRTCASQHQLVPEQIPADLEHQISWLHTSGVMLREEPAASIVLDAMRRCRAAGVPVSLDIMARIESLKDPVFMQKLTKAAAMSTVLLGSVRDEIPLLANGTSPESIRALTAGGRIVAARDGANGSTVYTETETLHCPAFPVPVVDTIGAGDAYNAGFIAAMLRGESLAAANRAGCAMGSYCVTQKGGRIAPTAKDIIPSLSAADAVSASESR